MIKDDFFEFVFTYGWVLMLVLTFFGIIAFAEVFLSTNVQSDNISFDHFIGEYVCNQTQDDFNKIIIWSRDNSKSVVCGDTSYDLNNASIRERFFS